MLAGMSNAPGMDDPLHNLLAARSRAAVVIDAMVAKISQADDTVLRRVGRHKGLATARLCAQLPWFGPSFDLRRPD